MKHQEQLKKLQPISLVDVKVRKDDEYICVAGVVEFGNGDVVLEISVYENDGGIPKILVRHFMDTKNRNFGTYFVQTATVGGVTHKAGEWSSMQYETIIGKQYYSSYYKPKNTRYVMSSSDIIKEYFRNERFGTSDSESIIGRFERDVLFDKRLGAEERKRERIHQRMAGVKPTDENFREWLMTTIFPERYLFAREKTKAGRRCLCSECRSEMLITEKLVHNQTFHCSKCGTKLVVKTRQKAVWRKANVMVIQPYDSVNYVIRHFRVYLGDEILDKGLVETFNKEERIRMFQGEDYHADIYYGTRSMADEELQGWWTQKNGTVIDSQMYLYPDGIRDIFEERGLSETLYKLATDGGLYDYNSLIRCYSNKPYIEYVVKAGLTKLASQLMRSWHVTSHSFLYGRGENLKELFCLNGQQVNRIKEMNGGRYAIEALQRETEDNPISKENLEYIDNNEISLNQLCTDVTGLKWNKVLNYLRRQQEKQLCGTRHIIQKYQDYLRMAQERGMDPADDIVRLNAKMVEWHDRYVAEAEQEAIDKRAKEVNAKYKNIADNYARNCELFVWQDDEFMIVVPKKASDIVLEGRIQHHCVGNGDRYIQNMNEDKGFILFLRKLDDLDKPYYTIELSPDWDIRQRYAAYDRQPDIKHIDSVLKKWIKSKKPKEVQIKVAV